MRLLEIHATPLKAAVSVESPRFLALLTSLLHAQRSKIIRALFVLENTLFCLVFFPLLPMTIAKVPANALFSFSRAELRKAARHKVQAASCTTIASKCRGDRIIMQKSIYTRLHAHAKRLEVAPASAASTQWQQGSMERENY